MTQESVVDISANAVIERYEVHLSKATSRIIELEVVTDTLTQRLSDAQIQLQATMPATATDSAIRQATGGGDIIDMPSAAL